jgi:hypothetical protein
MLKGPMRIEIASPGIRELKANQATLEKQIAAH